MAKTSAPSHRDRRGVSGGTRVYKGAEGYKPPSTNVPRGTYLKVECETCGAKVGARCSPASNVHPPRKRAAIALLMREREAAAALTTEMAAAPELPHCPQCGAPVKSRGPFVGAGEKPGLYVAAHVPGGARPSRGKFRCLGSYARYPEGEDA